MAEEGLGYARSRFDVAIGAQVSADRAALGGNSTMTSFFITFLYAAISSVHVTHQKIICLQAFLHTYDTFFTRVIPTRGASGLNTCPKPPQLIEQISF